MTAWLDFAPTAFDRKARPVADALFSVDEAAGLDLDTALFDADGEPMPEAVAPLSPAQRAALEAERDAVLARLSQLDAMLSA